jgi:hypothetical protein
MAQNPNPNPPGTPGNPFPPGPGNPEPPQPAVEEVEACEGCGEMVPIGTLSESEDMVSLCPKCAALPD